jgi:hypothetical protein
LPSLAAIAQVIRSNPSSAVEIEFNFEDKRREEKEGKEDGDKE